jgi:hypothetical protein
MRDHTIRELEILYSYHDSVLHRDRHLFFENIAEHQGKPSQLIRQWLNSYKGLILQSIKEAKSLSIRHVRILHHYFGTG